jgi:hypothetical protein
MKFKVENLKWLFEPPNISNKKFINNEVVDIIENYNFHIYYVNILGHSKK